MTKTISASQVQVITKSITRNLMAALALGMLFTACKKDDDDKGPDGPGQAEESYFPTQTNKVWKYRSDDDGDISEHNLRVISQKDSAGGKVFHYQMAFEDGSKVNPYVHYANGTINFANPLPADIAEQLSEITNDPSVSDFTITGFPLLQKLPSNPKVNDAVQFSEPLHIGWNMHDEEDVYPVSMDFTFSEGKIVGFEDVTTPAGTFKNCVKWQYKATLTTDFGIGQPNSRVMQNTLWYAKGVGLVKSTQTTGNNNSTTTLIAVQ